MKKCFFLVLFSLIFLVSCNLEKDKTRYIFDSKKQKKEIEKFFRNLLFWEGGAYTLLGSKPITIFEIFESEESPKNFSDRLDYAIYINKDEKEDLKFYNSLKEKQKKNVALFSDQDFIFDSYSLWNSWENFSSKINLSKKYLLFKKKFPPEELKNLNQPCYGYYITFVNVLKTACLLEKHYDLFKRAFGRDFDPLEEVLNIENSESLLWKCLYGEKPEEYYREIGLLLGYGLENTQIFKWKYQQVFKKSSKENVYDFLNQIDGISSEDVRAILQKPYPFSVVNFPLPIFKSFLHSDLTKQKYIEERKQIMAFYKGKDFVEATIDILSGNTVD